jgi:hypothetical protein
MGMVAHTCNPSSLGAETGGSAWANVATFYLKKRNGILSFSITQTELQIAMFSEISQAHMISLMGNLKQLLPQK